MRKNRINIGISLVIFSIFLFAFGFVFSVDLKESKKKDVLSFEKPKQSNIIVSTNDNTNSIVSDQDSQKDNTSQNNNVIPNISTFPNVPGNSEEKPIAIETIDKKIDKLKNAIKESYGVNVFYNEEIKDYTVGGYSIEIEDNVSIIYNALNNLQNCLALYPNGFFREMINGGLPLNIYLIKKYSIKDVTGITEKNGQGVIISIALDFPFSDSFHHEVYHYIEYYINLKGGYYTNWNNYNPSGFSYGNYDNRYTFDSSFSEDAFFVNSYAQSYEYEDRASTFEYMMTSNKISALNYGNNIWLKGKVMCEMIDYYLETVTSNATEYWERFIYS